jgi:D-sedoheptulose 7-phosphate isomerase
MAPREAVRRHLDAMADIVARVDDEAVVRVVDALHEAYRAGRLVVTIGNGGSASTAAHLAADLGKFATFPAPGFRAIDLVSNTAALTAWVNDEGWEHAYDHALRSWVSPGDVVVAFSVHGGDGWSGNLVRALEAANELGCTTIGVAANDGGAFRRVCDHVVVVPEPPAGLRTPVTEAVHVVVHHVVCAALRDRIAAPPS